MNRFLKEVSLFLAIFGAVNLVNFLPAEWYTYRNWEALSFYRLGQLSYGAFYSNESTLRTEVGDLAHHSEFEEHKDNVYWRTDLLGNRNDGFVQEPDVVLVGDSDLAGSGVSQEDTLGSLISRGGVFSAYSIAPRGMEVLLQLLAHKVIEAPRVVVYERIERDIPGIPSVGLDSTTSTGAMIHWLRTSEPAKTLIGGLDKVMAQRPLRFLGSRLRGNTGLAIGVQSPVDASFFFLRDSVAKARLNNGMGNDRDLENAVRVLTEYRDLLAKQNIQFIFLPVPNKETVYYELVPLEQQPVFLGQLIERLRDNGIHVLDTLTLFNQEAQKEPLYLTDDTHWNEKATRLAYCELMSHLNELIPRAKALG